MLPFTPVNKEIAIGWLAARCDGENYGKLLVYLFPKGQTVLGPSQIENLIGQDTVITEQLALWGRGGSQVIRGNLLLIPLGKSILYVEPVFLQAEAGGLPQMKRVIVVAGEQIAMELTLAESLTAIFLPEFLPGAEAPPTEIEVVVEPPAPPEPEEPVTAEIANLIEEAQLHYNKALQYFKEGDLAGWGREMSAFGIVWEQIVELVAEE